METSIVVPDEGSEQANREYLMKMNYGELTDIVIKLSDEKIKLQLKLDGIKDGSKLFVSLGVISDTIDLVKHFTDRECNCYYMAEPSSCIACHSCRVIGKLQWLSKESE